MARFLCPMVLNPMVPPLLALRSLFDRTVSLGSRTLVLRLAAAALVTLSFGSVSAGAYGLWVIEESMRDDRHAVEIQKAATDAGRAAIEQTNALRAARHGADLPLEPLLRTETPHFEARVGALIDMTRGNPAQSARVQALRQAEQAMRLELAARPFDAPSVGRKTVEFQSQVQAIVEAEERAAAIRHARRNQAFMLVRTVGLIVGALILVFGCLIGVLTLGRLVRAERAARSMAELKSRALSVASHEIRTPLNGMLGMAQAMTMGPLDPEQRDRLDVLRESGEALLALLNDLLDTSKIEAGRLDLVAEPFDLHRVLNRIELTFAPAAAAKGVELSIAFDPASATVWIGDGLRLGQICTNLVSNAVKFTQTGRVDILVDQPAEGGLRIVVRDTGMGMSAETVDGLFKPFGQANAKTSHQFGGTGLGLAISRSLARLMSGDLVVESRCGKGSAFTLTLPLSPAGAMTPNIVTPEPVEVSLSGLRILAADDNAVNRQVLQAVLDSLGIESTILDGGSAAVDAFRCAEFDAVILDLRMPGCDGLQAAAMIRTHSERRGMAPIPIILLSGDVSEDVRREGRAHGIEHFVAKPLEISVLVDVLSRIESRAVGLGPNADLAIHGRRDPLPQS